MQMKKSWGKKMMPGVGKGLAWNKWQSFWMEMVAFFIFFAALLLIQALNKEKKVIF